MFISPNLLPGTIQGATIVKDSEINVVITFYSCFFKGGLTWLRFVFRMAGKISMLDMVPYTICTFNHRNHLLPSVLQNPRLSWEHVLAFFTQPSFFQKAACQIALLCSSKSELFLPWMENGKLMIGHGKSKGWHSNSNVRLSFDVAKTRDHGEGAHLRKKIT